MDTRDFTDWLEIDLSAVRNNIQQFQHITGRPVMAVVKANAYGHGMIPVARAVLKGGAAWLGVARFEEAAALRAEGIQAPVLVLGYTAPQLVPQAVQAGITLSAGDAGVAQQYSQAAAGLSSPLRLHAKIDSGMGRLGVLAENGFEFIRLLSELPGLLVEGLFTHFACADERDPTTTMDQLSRFKTLLEGLTAAGLRPPLVHAANSAASLYYPDAYFDLVRPGIAIYGLNPSREAPVTPDFRAALAWKTRLTSVKVLPAGHGVSYGHRYHTPATELMGALAVGYADGLRRKLNANACIAGGQKLPIVGTVCMDQAMVPLDTVPDARIGDEVILIGEQGGQRITADDLAEAWGTINYEVTCGLTARVPRVYLNE